MPEWTISDRLRKAREISGLDQTQFAAALGVSRATVSKYERGTGTYRRPVLLAWAMCAGVPMEWLRSGQQETPHPTESDEGLDVVRREGIEPPTRWFRVQTQVPDEADKAGTVIPIRRLRPLKVLPLKGVPLRLVPALSLDPSSTQLRAA